MIAVMRSKIREEARSPALPPLMPSDTAKTRSQVATEASPASPSFVAPLISEEKTIHESSLRGLRVPLTVAPAHRNFGCCGTVQGFSVDFGSGRISASSKSIMQKRPSLSE